MAMRNTRRERRSFNDDYKQQVLKLIRAGDKSIWEEEAYLKSSTIRLQGYFGYLVDVCADSSTVVVAAPGDKSIAYSDCLANVFSKSSGAWSQQGDGLAAELTRSSALDLSSSGDVFVV